MPKTKQEDPDSKILPLNLLDKNMNSAEGYHHLQKFISPKAMTKD